MDSLTPATAGLDDRDTGIFGGFALAISEIAPNAD
jgi:hypothetical protein